MSDAADEPYRTEFEATVEDVSGRRVVLSETYFYPEGGGQPADRGTVDGVAVEDVQSEDGDVVHVLATEPDFAAGETVACMVDDEFRTYCMRAHTASHALYGAGRRHLADLGYGGFDIGPEKVRVDFETSTEIDDAVLAALERDVNEVVWDSREVSWERVPREDAFARDDLAFNVATEEGVMAGSETVRVVEIEGWDAAACGGTHVSNTREIGPVTVLDRSNPGEGMTRVEFAVGPASIERRADERRALTDAAAELGVGTLDVPEATRDLRERVDSLESDLADARDELFAARVDGFERVEKAGASWLVGGVEEFDANAVSERLRDYAGDAADAVAVAGVDGRGFVVVATDGSVDAGGVVERVTDEFGGGGGGSPEFAQAGGLDASVDDLVSFLRSD